MLRRANLRPALGRAAVLGLLIAWAAAAPAGWAQDDATKSADVVKIKATADKPGADGKQVVTVTIDIEKGWHIYANPVGNPDQESAATTVTITGKTNPKDVKVDYPKGKLVRDMLVGNYIVYDGEVVIKAVVERAKGDTGPLEVSVKLQSCNESTCLLPATIKLSVP